MRDPLPNPWPGNPNAYECPWGCNGTGTMPWFAHIEGGICFSCHGQGWILGRGQQQAQPQQRRQQWRREGRRIVAA